MGVRKLAGQTLIYGFGTIAGRALNLALTFVYVAYFDPAEFGLFSYFYALVSYPLIVLTLGMETAFFRFAGLPGADPERTYSNSFWSVTYLTVAVAALAWVFDAELAAAVGYPDRVLLLRYLIGITVFDVLAAVPLARLRYRERPLRFALINLSNVGFMLVLNLVFVVVLRQGIESIFLANLIASGLRLAVALVGGLPEHNRWHWPTVRPMLAFGGLVMVAGFAGQLNEMLDKNLVVVLWPEGKVFRGAPTSGEALNGIYNASYKFGMIIALATQAYRYAAEPFFFRRTGSGHDPVLLAKTFHYFALACLGTTLLVGAFCTEIARFTGFGLLRQPLLRAAYQPGLAIVPIVLFANTFLGLYISASIWFKLRGQVGWGLGFTLVGTAITLAINYLGIPWYGYYAAAWAHLACYGVMFWLCYGVGQYHMPVPYRIGRLLLYGGLVALVVVGRPWVVAAWGLAGYVGVVLGALGLVVAFERGLPIRWATSPRPG